MKGLLSSAFVLTCFLIQTNCTDKYTDENRPYEFGFKIDGQQDRHEKKDKNGIIMGEFGFITADDVYHVTVYATDEQGRFKILSMKNIHLKDTKSVTSARQGHSLQIPSTHQVPTIQTTTTTTSQPIKTIAQEFEPVSLEPPANSCSHCSLPTTSTAAPKPLLSLNQPNANIGYNTLGNSVRDYAAQKTVSQTSSVASNSFSSNVATQQTSISGLQNSVNSNQPNYGEVGLGVQQNSPSVLINKQDQSYHSVSEYQRYATAGQNYPTAPATQQSSGSQGINGGREYIQTPKQNQKFPTFTASGEQSYSQEIQRNTLIQSNNAQITQQPASGAQSYSNEGQNYVQKNNAAQENYSRSNYPQGGTQQNYQPKPNSANYQRNNPQEGQGQNILQPTIEQGNSYISPQSPPQEPGSSSSRSLGSNSHSNELYDNKNNYPALQHNVEQTPRQISASGNVPGIRTPKQFNEGEAVPVRSGQKPTLAYAQMQIVDRNTDINARAPGEKEGLPEGLTKNDMVRLLYTFNYTLGFQGHFEEGYSNGVKQGYYFVTGRNGVRTRIDYTADDKGFHPKISQDVLDLQSDDVPKPETEKEAKYGLKGYEFKWLYYPLDSKTR